MNLNHIKLRKASHERTNIKWSHLTEVSRINESIDRNILLGSRAKQRQGRTSEYGICCGGGQCSNLPGDDFKNSMNIVKATALTVYFCDCFCSETLSVTQTVLKRMTTHIYNWEMRW